MAQPGGMDVTGIRVAVVSVSLIAAFLAAAPSAQAGSICKDGTWTPSEGRGTCSHHGGVAQSGVPNPNTAPAQPAAPTETSAPVTAPSPAQAPAAPAAVASGGSFLQLTAAIPSRGVTGSDTGSVRYSRKAFKHWITQADGCSTREVVLILEAVGGTRQGCAVVGATWVSMYDAAQTGAPGSFDIDHVVPLKEAWLSGADSWTPERRQAFANDLGYADSLIAVSASSNRSKSDKDPARWMPPNPAVHCTYIAAWVAVKYRWNLAMDDAERQKVDSVLASCPSTGISMPERAN